MLFGTERRVAPATAPHERRNEHNPAAEPSPVFNLASLAAFAFGFGLSAYLLTRFSPLPIEARVIIAGITGGAAMGLQSILIARWAIPGARAEQLDERYLLQGAIGRVTVAIAEHGVGEIEYTLDDRTYALPARTIDDAAVSARTEVVIDRVESGVAYVEPWSRVESRL